VEHARLRQSDMGTTCTVLALQGRHLQTWWCGDSPAFALPPPHGNMTHAWVAKPHMYEVFYRPSDFPRGEVDWIKDGDADLAYCLGGHLYVDTQPHEFSAAGGLVGACSDGLSYDNTGTGNFRDAQLQAESDLEAMARAVLEPVLLGMGDDTRTITAWPVDRSEAITRQAKKDNIALILHRVKSAAELRSVTWEMIAHALRQSGRTRREIDDVQRALPPRIHPERLLDIVDLAALARAGALLKTLQKLGVLGAR